MIFLKIIHFFAYKYVIQQFIFKKFLFYVVYYI